ncbi:MAG: pyruvate, phosphate dikinase [Deltaproteobacteria bacterium]|nr:pyruvate, phosphate dikinase [Deltaproteobacteria bacterium]
MSKLVYSFGGGKAEGRGAMKELLGGKGANLAEMVNIGLPVPPGFTITTEVCSYFFAHGNQYPAELRKQVDAALALMSKRVGKNFGDPSNPLLVSVRSGAPASMPGMMDTILNLGLNDATAAGLAKLTADERFVMDAYRRLVTMYGDVVLGIARHKFDHELEATKQRLGLKFDNEVPAAELRKLVATFKAIVLRETGKPFPEDPVEQLWGAVGAVFGSWNNPRAIVYRRQYRIPEHWGTATNVQAMVFGNMGEDCATGVAFTRDPAAGEHRFFGEWLQNAQGEDVVAGIRTPLPLDRNAGGEKSLEAMMPECHRELVTFRDRLENHYRDMQDLEFTIEHGKLWMLQTRTGKRTGFAAARIAVEMQGEGLISKTEALMRVEPDHLNQLLQPVFDPNDRKKAVAEKRLVAKGLAAGPGGASGKAVFSAEAAEAYVARGEKVVLVRQETSPEDIRGMLAAQGILTARGGMTSHAALVARQMGKVCVTGCSDIVVDYATRSFGTPGGTVVREGDPIAIDGTLGEVMVGAIKTVPSEVQRVLITKTLKAEDAPVYRIFEKLLGWADEVRRLKVRTNADQPDQAAHAVAFGAEGIGLCRTEHMFFGEGKIGPMREMILADTTEERQKALDKLLPLQRADFTGIFLAMGPRPVTIRTLDPPLHEFLPHEEKATAEVAREMNVPPAKIADKVRQLHEFNPMLGHRGCRLGISYPEITAMQGRAILEAALDAREQGVEAHPEIMIPFVGHVRELQLQAQAVRDEVAKVFAERGKSIPYTVGTMIEIPRGALTADEVAGVAEFFSFGTNDLTQMCLGMSRDDSASFLGRYRELKIYERDPFETIDRIGVGMLMRIAVEKGRSAQPKLKVGICGEQGGDPASVEFCHMIGLDYVSCSPFRVPIARLAAAQAALREKKTPARLPAKKTPAKKTAGRGATPRRPAAQVRPRPARKAAKPAVKRTAKKPPAKKAPKKARR